MLIYVYNTLQGPTRALAHFLWNCTAIDASIRKSELVQVMILCCHTTGHYLNHCLPISISPHGVTGGNESSPSLSGESWYTGAWWRIYASMKYVIINSDNDWSLVRCHYNDVIMTTIASQITSLTIVYSTVYSDADQRKHQSSASLAFVRRIHRGPVNSPHKWPITRKLFPFDDVIMQWPLVLRN